MWIDQHPEHGPIVCSLGTAEVIRYVDGAGSKFFTPDTMKWFGTRNLEMIGGRVMIGLDTKAPDGYPRYWARVFQEGTGYAEKVAAAHTRNTIRKEARRIAQEIADYSEDK